MKNRFSIPLTRNAVPSSGDMLELGEGEKAFHEDIGQAVNPDSIDFLFTYGDLGAYIAKGALKHFPEHRVSSTSAQAIHS